MLRRLLLGLLAVIASTASAASSARAQPAPAAQPPGALTVVILPIVSTDVDPIVPQRVLETARAAARDAGYELATDAALSRALASVRPSNPPTPSEVWRITALAGAQRGLSIRIGVADGLYVGELFVASTDGSGPYRAELRGDGGTFLDYVTEAIRRTLPAPSTFDPEAAQRYASGVQNAPMRPAAPSWSTATFARSYSAAPTPAQPRYGLTFVSESAFGRSQGSRYYHHGLGARMDFAFGTNVVIGLFAGYLNLDLGPSRASNLLFFAQLEDRLQFVATGRVRFPLRLAFGYVPFNGPFLRFSGGIRFPVGGPFEIGLDLLAPTFWWIPGDRRVTYDVSAELTYRFGPSR